MENYPFVSVIVPVYNNCEQLKICLQSLHDQTYPHNCYEVIVVDNASSEDIESATHQFSQVTFTSESKPGSYAARNQGISLAKGEVVAFTDSDCIPAKNWLEKGVEKLIEFPDCGLVGGKIELFFQMPGQPTAIEFYEAITYLDQKQNISQSKFSATANLFTFSSRFKAVGLFDDELKSGGDLEWCKRVASRGYQLIYAEDVYVKHPARSSFKELHKRITRMIGGHYQLGTTKIGIYDPKEGDLSLIREILQRLKPPIKYLKWRLSDDRLKENKQKLLFIAVIIFVNYTIALELIRLRLGGKPESERP